MPVKETIGNPSLPFSKFEEIWFSSSTTQVATQSRVDLWPLTITLKGKREKRIFSSTSAFFISAVGGTVFY